MVHLFYDTACTDSTPDMVTGNSNGVGAPSAMSGSGWMSFKVVGL